MPETIKPQPEELTRSTAFAIFVAVAAFTSVLLLIGTLTNLGQAEANAPALASEQIVSPEEHSAFIREGHDRAARDGDAAPLPATF